jgi:hypothetical protein
MRSFNEKKAKSGASILIAGKLCQLIIGSRSSCLSYEEIKFDQELKT